MRTQTGIEEWQAPEMLLIKSYDEKVDLWSAGCAMYFALVGQKPFGIDNVESKNVARIYQQIMNGDFDKKNDRWNRITTKAQNCIKKLIEPDVKKRYSAEESL